MEGTATVLLPLTFFLKMGYSWYISPVALHKVSLHGKL